MVKYYQRECMYSSTYKFNRKRKKHGMDMQYWIHFCQFVLCSRFLSYRNISKCKYVVYTVTTKLYNNV